MNPQKENVIPFKRLDRLDDGRSFFYTKAMKAYSESELLDACYSCDQYHADCCYCEKRNIEIDWEDYPVYDEDLDELCDKWKVIVDRK